MWKVLGSPTPHQRFNLAPMRVLYEFDGPRIFICQSTDGVQLLAYLCGQDEITLRYLLVECRDDLEQRLTLGETTVREALFQPRVWLVDTDLVGTIRDAWETNAADLPPRALPKPGALLWASLLRQTNAPGNGAAVPLASRDEVANRG